MGKGKGGRGKGRILSYLPLLPLLPTPYSLLPQRPADRLHVVPLHALPEERGRGAGLGAEAFDVVGLVFAPSAADLRITLDTPEDLEALRALVAVRGDGIAHRTEILRVMRAHPHIAQLNAEVVQKPLEAG